MTEKLRIPERRELPATWIELLRDHLADELAPRRQRRRRLVIALVPAILILLAATAFKIGRAHV